MPSITITISEEAYKLLKAAKKKENDVAIEGIDSIAYKNYYAGFYWRLGELVAEKLSPEDRNLALATVMRVTNFYIERENRKDIDGATKM